MKVLRTTALTAALMTAAVPSLTTPANAWGWGWGGVGLGLAAGALIGTAIAAYASYGYGYPAYGYGYGTGYYGGYRYAYHPVVRHIYATAVGVRRHWRY